MFCSQLRSGSLFTYPATKDILSGNIHVGFLMWDIIIIIKFALP